MEFGSVLKNVTKPTLMLDEKTARQNIHIMAAKAKKLSVSFRPHFKTHQSAQIGEWFRDVGVTRITVSSLEMAEYFMEHDWRDILVAFPINWREIQSIRQLAHSTHLGLLVDSLESAQFLAENLNEKSDVWIKIDTGFGRAGIHWQDKVLVHEMIQKIRKSDKLRVRGLLTHAGQTYRAKNTEEIKDFARQSLSRILMLKRDIKAAEELEISIGDTPGCALMESFEGANEIRPGNFVFYDASMLQLGVCKPDDIAVRLACPVTGKFGDEQKLVIYGGAIHLSKESLKGTGDSTYGWISLPEKNRWGNPMLDSPLMSLSQEHGVAKPAGHAMNQIQLGELVGIVPVHSCLTVAAMGEYLTYEGMSITTMRDWLINQKLRSALA